MIVVDSSAIVAIRMEQPPWEKLLDRLLDEPISERRMSVAAFLEAGTVLAGRMPDPNGAIASMEEFVAEHSLELVPTDSRQIRIALQARIRYGRGFGHPAKLNFGDCFSYALAKTLKAPLLYVGDDFGRTDIRSALRRPKARRRP